MTMAVTIFGLPLRRNPVRRYSRPLTETRRHRYRVERTTRQEASQWAAEDRAKALAHLQRLAEAGPLTPVQAEQLLRLLDE